MTTETAGNDIFYNKCHDDLKSNSYAMKYLTDRGITEESINNFHLGYCENWTPTLPEGAELFSDKRETNRIIIPRSFTNYAAIEIDGKGIFSYSAEGEVTNLYNQKVLNSNTSIVFVTLSEMDVITLSQMGFNAIGIYSKGNMNRFVKEASKHPKTAYILLFDNSEEYKVETDKANLLTFVFSGNSYIETILNEESINYAYIKHKEKLVSKLTAIYERISLDQQERARQIENEIKQNTGVGMFEDFFKIIRTEKYAPVETGITQIDEMLNGGFTRGTLAMLGAAPGMGKTCFSQWIFETMATKGHEVIYLNLEMSRDQLLARSLSRILYGKFQRNYSALKIMRGYGDNWTEIQQKDIKAAADYYIQNIAQRVAYNPSTKGASRCAIINTIKSEILRIQGEGRDTPIICLDYLQLVEPEAKEDATEAMKKTIMDLKRIAIEYNTIVFCIIANNRTSNKTGTVEMESGRDTSTLEYSADLFLGLAYTFIEDRKQMYVGTNKDGTEKTDDYSLEKIHQEKRVYENNEEVRRKYSNSLNNSWERVTVKVIKNRFGASEKRVDMIFKGEYSHYSIKK